MIATLMVAASLHAEISPAKAVWAQEDHAGLRTRAPQLMLAQATPAPTFNLPSQPLDRALVAFGRQAGMQVSFEAAVAGGMTANAVSGALPPRRALSALLEGTGLEANFVGANGVVVYRPNIVVAQAAEADFSLDQIFVTGEKIERSYLDTFTSVGIATGEEIETYGLEDLYETFNTMANVRDFNSGRGGTAFQIRGINADGVTEPDGNAPVITMIIDGVTQSAEAMKRGTRGSWDLKQVEVLRGPQSTLQGRNALAGAVVVESNDPTYTPEMKFKLLGGQFDRKEGAVALSFPVIDNQMAFRFAGEYRDRVEDISYVDPVNAPLGDDKYHNMRGKLLIEPEAIDNLRVMLTASSIYDKPGASAVTGPNFFDRVLIVPSAGTEFREMRVDNYSADTSYAIGDRLTLRSVTAKHETDLDIKSAPGSPSFLRSDTRKDDDFTQDVRLEIKERDNRAPGFSGVIGAFYGDFSRRTDTDLTALNVVFMGFPIGDVLVQRGWSTYATETTAAYADLRYRFNSWFSVLGGARYQKDEVTQVIDIDADALVGGPTQFTGTAEYTPVMPKYGVAFDLSDHQTIAATASRGYRQGKTERIIGTGQVYTVDPEYMWTYELAYRRTSPDGRLTFGANAFYNDYTDQQITLVNPDFPPFTNTFNAGESKSYGAEIETRYRFDNGLRVFGALGLLHTEFTELEVAACPGGNCAGNEYPEAPAVTFSFGGHYKHHSGFFVTAHADYVSDYFAFGDITNTPTLEIDGRFVANARVGYEFDQNLVASVYVDNLFDEDYLTGLATSGTEGYVGEGRTIGVELRATF